jgi:PAP2 superfamily
MLSMSVETLSISQSGKTKRAFEHVMAGCLAHVPLFAIALVYFASTYVALEIFPGMQMSGLNFAVGAIIFAMVPGALAIAYEVVVENKSLQPMSDLLRGVWRVFTNARSLARGLPVYLSLMLFTHGFNFYKANLVHIQPFSWDQTFDRWDTTLFLGYRPWEVLQPLLGNVPSTLLLSNAYNVWFLLLIVVWFHFAFMTKSSHSRLRFFIAFMLTWSIGGSLLASIFASAGPCYYGLLGLSPDPYATLLTYLQTTNQTVTISALTTQQFLWDLHASGTPVGGISAMPSMHNATVVLFVLAAWRSRKWLRNAAIAYCILIFIGSIHLGWHYAIDGLAAAALAALCWMIADRLASWWCNKPLHQKFEALQLG